jgi:hypothetical protein
VLSVGIAEEVDENHNVMVTIGETHLMGSPMEQSGRVTGRIESAESNLNPAGYTIEFNHTQTLIGEPNVVGMVGCRGVERFATALPIAL